MATIGWAGPSGRSTAASRSPTGPGRVNAADSAGNVGALMRAFYGAAATDRFDEQKRQRRPEAALRKRARDAAYLRLPTIQSTVALTCSSLRDGLPPLAGITPALPVKPSMACLYSVSLPWATRGPQWAWSRVGAPPAPEVWQPVHSWPKITEPSVVPP